METHDQSQFLPSIVPIDTSPFSNLFFLNSSQDQAAAHGEHHLHRHQEEKELHDLLSIGGSNTHHVLDQKEQLTVFLSIGGSSDHPILDQKQQHQEKPKIILSLGESSNYPPVIVDQCSGKRNQQHETCGSVKWMSSKMRLMRKMMSGDQIVIRKQRRNSKSLQEKVQPNHVTSNNNTSPSGIIRVCSNCNTTKTPLWRSGPQGPKSLCNACGIRQMKARRAMRAAAAAAAAAAGFSSSSNVVSGIECKLQKEEVDRTVPFKKRFKITSLGSAQKKLRFDEVAIKKLGFHQAFPQEERDAAILLMGLSCGLIHS